MRRKNSSPPTIGLENYTILLVLIFIAGSFAAPIQESTDISQFSEGCYYNYNHYNEGDRILTNEPCLNCTCHNNMLMCYLRVCPFTKPIGQDCIIEKREDQCCPIITCPEVQVDVMMHKGTAGSSAIGFAEKYGCVINNKFFPEGSQVPSNPNRPCELCYCIRNSTSCLMQECTLHIDGCQPIYHKGSCCPVRYNCDHELPEIEDMTTTTTTVRPTEGFIMTTIGPDVSEQCTHNGDTYLDGAMIETENPCDSCYCMKGKIVCAVRECTIPSQYIGRNCTPENVSDNECCPQRFKCDDYGIESTTKAFGEELTTLVEDKTEPAISEEDEQLQKHIDDVEGEVKPVTQKPGPEENVTLGGRLDIPEEEKATDIPEVTIPSESSETVTPVIMLTKQPSVEDITEKDRTTPVSIEISSTEKPDEEVGKPISPVTVTISPSSSEAMPDQDVLGSITTEAPKEGASTTKGEEGEKPIISTETPKGEEQVTLTGEETTEPSQVSVDLDKEPVTISSEEGVTEGMLVSKEEKDKQVTPIIAEHATEISPAAESITKMPSLPKADEGEETATSELEAGITVGPSLSRTPEDEHVTLSSGEISTESPSLSRVDQESEAITPISAESATKISPVDEDKKEITSDISTAESTTAYPKDEKATPTPKPDGSEEQVTSSSTESEKETGSTPRTEKGEEMITIGLVEGVTEGPSSPRLDVGEITFTPSPSKTEEEQEQVTETATKAVTKGPSSPTVEEIEEQTTLIPSDGSTKAPVTQKATEVEEQSTDKGTEDKTSKPKETDAAAVEEIITTRIPEGITEEPPKSSEEELSTEDIDLAIPFAIPGEGDCLLDRKTYKNNTTVPSSNECEYECMCVSSMIKCKTIECTQAAGPECTIIEPAPGACCPTLLCPESQTEGKIGDHTTIVAEEASKERAPELGERVDSEATETPEEKEVESTTGTEREKDAKKDDSMIEEMTSTTPSEKGPEVYTKEPTLTEGPIISEKTTIRPTGLDISAPTESIQTELPLKDKVTEEGSEEATKPSITPDKTTPSLLEIKTLQPGLEGKKPGIQDSEEPTTTKPEEIDRSMLLTTLSSMMVPEDETFKPILETIPSDSHMMVTAKPEEEPRKPESTELPVEKPETAHEQTDKPIEDDTKPSDEMKLKETHSTEMPMSTETDRPESTDKAIEMVPFKGSTEEPKLEKTEKPFEQIPEEQPMPSSVPVEDHTGIPEEKPTSIKPSELESGTKRPEEQVSTSMPSDILSEGTEKPKDEDMIEIEQPVDKEKVAESLEGRLDQPTTTPEGGAQESEVTEKLPEKEIESMPESETKKPSEVEGEPDQQEEKETEVTEKHPEEKTDMQTESAPEKETEKLPEKDKSGIPTEPVLEEETEKPSDTETKPEKEEPELSEKPDMQTESVSEEETEKPIKIEGEPTKKTPEITEKLPEEKPDMATELIPEKETDKPSETERESEKGPQESTEPTETTETEKSTKPYVVPEVHSEVPETQTEPQKPTDISTVPEGQTSSSETIEKESTEPTLHTSTTEKSQQELQKEISSLPEDSTKGSTEPTAGATEIPSSQKDIEKHPDEAAEGEKESEVIATTQATLLPTKEKTEMPPKDKETETETQTEIPEEEIKSLTESSMGDTVTASEEIPTEKGPEGEIETPTTRTDKPAIEEIPELSQPSESTELPEKEPSKETTEVPESQTDREEEIAKERTEKPADETKVSESTKATPHLEPEDIEGSGSIPTSETPSAADSTKTEIPDQPQLSIEQGTEPTKHVSEEETDHSESPVESETTATDVLQKTEASVAKTEKPELEPSSSAPSIPSDSTEPSRELPSDSQEISQEDRDKKTGGTEIPPREPSYITDKPEEIKIPTELPTRFDSSTEHLEDQKLPDESIKQPGLSSERPEGISTVHPYIIAEHQTEISKEGEETRTEESEEQPETSELPSSITELPKGDAQQPIIPSESTEIPTDTPSKKPEPSQVGVEDQTKEPESEETTKKSEETPSDTTTLPKEIQSEIAIDEITKPATPSGLETSTEPSEQITEESDIRKGIEISPEEKEKLATTPTVSGETEIQTEKPFDIESADHVTEISTGTAGPLNETIPTDRTESPIQISPDIPTSKPEEAKPIDQTSASPKVGDGTDKPKDEGTEKPIPEGEIPESTERITKPIDGTSVSIDIIKATDKPEKERTEGLLHEKELPESTESIIEPIDETGVSDEIAKTTSKPEEGRTKPSIEEEIPESTEGIAKPVDQSSISPVDVLATTEVSQITERPAEEKLPGDIEKEHPSDIPESTEPTVLSPDLADRLDETTSQPETKLPEEDILTKRPIEIQSSTEKEPEIATKQPSEEREPSEESTAKPTEIKTELPSEVPSVTEKTHKEPSIGESDIPSFTEEEQAPEEITSIPSKETPKEPTVTQVPLLSDLSTSTEKSEDEEEITAHHLEGVSTEVPSKKPLSGIPEEETRTPESPEEETEKPSKDKTETEKPTHLLPVLPEEETQTEVPEEQLSQTTQKISKPEEEEATEIPKKDEAFTKIPIEIPLNETKTDTPIEEPIIGQQTVSPLGDKTSKPSEDQKPEKETTEKPILEEETSTSTTTKVPLTTKPTFMPSIPGYIPPDMPTEYYDEPDDADIFGPGTCRYGGKLFVSAQQIPRDDPCDFCFCFRSDIICLQQSCPPPISGCNEEPIQGFCCPRYECPVSMGYNVNSTTSTTTTTLPPHFLHRRHQKVERNGCQIQGISYKVGDKIPSASGPCMQCTCGGDGQMECNPKPCTPEPMLRQMIAVVASRRRR